MTDEPVPLSVSHQQSLASVHNEYVIDEMVDAQLRLVIDDMDKTIKRLRGLLAASERREQALAPVSPEQRAKRLDRDG